MYTINTCPACAASSCKVFPALVSGFVKSRVLPPAASGLTCFAVCSNCGLQFFTDRFEPAELQRLYTGYRGADYLKQRQAAEFWYTERMNGELADSDEIVQQRQRSLAAYTALHWQGWQPPRILDYGGDRGQFIPAVWTGEKSVFEMSGIAPVDGVRSVAREAELQPAGYDCILLCHVLEHASAPAVMLAAIRPLLVPGGWLYIEVPAEEMRLSPFMQSRLYANWLQLTDCTPRLRRLVEFYSAAAKKLLCWIPPLGSARLHEHINFFAEGALRQVAEKADFTVVDVTREGDIWRVLAR